MTAEVERPKGAADRPALLAFSAPRGLDDQDGLRPRATGQGVLRTLAVLIVSLFLAELFVMLVLNRVQPDAVDRLATGLTDALFLVALVSPALYLFSLRPQLLQRQRERVYQAQLRAANEELTANLQELENQGRVLRLFGEMSEMLQACEQVEEAGMVFTTFVRELFPGSSGRLYLFRNSRDALVAAAEWGTVSAAFHFKPADCWSIRRGRPHQLAVDGPRICCAHLTDEGGESLCVPLTAQGEILGVLCFVPGAGATAWQRTVTLVAEDLALALGNLKLRETLRHLAIRDPLTGLFNRRFMEESLERELERANRRASQVAAVMFDVDHFKKVNDTLGHAAGDSFLKELASLLGRSVRAEDIICRFGGEEFLWIATDVADGFIERVETIRAMVKGLEVNHLGQALPPVSVSIGVAVFPHDGADSSTLLRAADEALYAAKRSGRDRIVEARVLERAAPGRAASAVQ